MTERSIPSSHCHELRGADKARGGAVAACCRTLGQLECVQRPAGGTADIRIAVRKNCPQGPDSPCVAEFAQYLRRQLADPPILALQIGQQAGNGPHVLDPSKGLGRFPAHSGITVLQRSRQGLDRPRVLEFAEGLGGPGANLPLTVVQGGEQRFDGATVPDTTEPGPPLRGHAD